MHAVSRLLRATVAAVAGWVVLSGSFDDHVFAQPTIFCEIVGSDGMAFGIYDPASNAHLDAQSAVSIRCGNKDPSDPRDPPTVLMSLSTGNAGSFNRQMMGERDPLRYNLFLDAQRTVVWGDGSAGTSVNSRQVQPNSQLETFPVFGRVFASQDVGASQYLDNLVVTLLF